MIDPFELSIDEGTSIISNPLFESWMHQLWSMRENKRLSKMKNLSLIILKSNE